MWSATAEILAVTEGIFIDCPEDPVKLKGAPIGMYHCPWCGCMQLAGLPHIHEEECGLGLGF
jgi:hypothetical protein